MSDPNAHAYVVDADVVEGAARAVGAEPAEAAGAAPASAQAPAAAPTEPAAPAAPDTVAEAAVATDSVDRRPVAQETVVGETVLEETVLEETVAEETVQGVPVLAEVRALQPPSSSSLPAVQAAAVAATGFVAGAATLALVRRHTARKLARTRQSRRALDALPIVGSRSFLVDVHLIAKPGE